MSFTTDETDNVDRNDDDDLLDVDVVESVVESEGVVEAEPVTSEAEPAAEIFTKVVSGLTRASAGRVISKYQELLKAPENRLQLLSGAIGGKPDPVELTKTVVSASRVNLTAITDLISLSEADPASAVLDAFGLPVESRKRVWVLLSILGQGTGSLPATEIAAAGKIARAATQLTPANLADLAAVRILGGK